MEEVSDNQLEWNFQEQSKNFCQYIFTHAKPKTIRDEIILTGNGESSLSQHVSPQFKVCDCTLGLLVILFPPLRGVEKAEAHATQGHACFSIEVSLYEGLLKLIVPNETNTLMT